MGKILFCNTMSVELKIKGYWKRGVFHQMTDEQKIKGGNPVGDGSFI